MLSHMSSERLINMMFLILWICCVIGLTNANYGSPPSMLTEDVTVEPDRTFVASCYGIGDVITDIYWSKPGGERIMDYQEGSIYSSRDNNQLLLMIVQPDQADDGEYVCQEISDGGETTMRKRLSLRVLSKSHPKFEKPYDFIQAYENENVTLVCEATGDQPIQYMWLDEHGSIITPDSNTVIRSYENCLELHLLHVSNETSRLYTCAAENPLGRSSKIFELVVVKKSRPVFNETRVVVNGTVDEPLTLVCQAEGKPQPTYAWYDKYGDKLDRYHQRVIDLDLWNDSSKIPQRGNSTILISPSNGTLTFVQLKKNDGGHYTCYATNSAGKAAKTYRIDVNASEGERPPVFNETSVVVHGSVDESLTLVCQAEGKPQPTYIWYNWYGEQLNRYHPNVIDLDLWNDSSVIPKRRNSTILVSPSNGTLTFVQLKITDGGRYPCYAVNSAGKAMKTYRIYVNETEDRSGVVTAHIQNVTHNSATFLLIAKGVSETDSFEGRYRLSDEKNFSNVSWMVGEEYKITGLRSGAKYYFKFRIVLSNNWTDLITVALPPGPPEIIVRQVASNRLNMEFFRPMYMFYYNTIQRYIIKYRTVQIVRGNSWDYSNCEVTIELPSCRASSYEISSLSNRIYYSVTVQAVGPGGYSDPTEIKIYME